MEEKLQDEEFLNDTDMILNPGLVYNPKEAWQVVHNMLVVRLKK